MIQYILCTFMQDRASLEIDTCTHRVTIITLTHVLRVNCSNVQMEISVESQITCAKAVDKFNCGSAWDHDHCMYICTGFHWRGGGRGHALTPPPQEQPPTMYIIHVDLKKIEWKQCLNRQFCSFFTHKLSLALHYACKETHFPSCTHTLSTSSIFHIFQQIHIAMYNVYAHDLPYVFIQTIAVSTINFNLAWVQLLIKGSFY